MARDSGSWPGRLQFGGGAQILGHGGAILFHVAGGKAATDGAFHDGAIGRGVTVGQVLARDLDGLSGVHSLDPLGSGLLEPVYQAPPRASTIKRCEM